MAGLGPDDSTASSSTLSRAGGPARRAGADRRLFGLLLIVFGVLWFLEGAHVLGLSVESLLSMFLITLGLGLLITHHSPGPARLPIILGAVTIIVLIGNSSSLHLPSVGSVGSHAFRPLTVDELRDSYSIGFGDLSVDLRQLDPVSLGGRQLGVNVGAGHARVQLPAETDVTVDSSLGAGEVVVCQHRLSGFAVSQTYDNDPGGSLPRLRINVSGGVGDVRILGCHQGP